jgi:hypothetical protein
LPSHELPAIDTVPRKHECCLPRSWKTTPADGFGWVARRAARPDVACAVVGRKHPRRGLFGRASEHARRPRVISRRQAHRSCPASSEIRHRGLSRDERSLRQCPKRRTAHEKRPGKLFAPAPAMRWTLKRRHVEPEARVAAPSKQFVWLSMSASQVWLALVKNAVRRGGEWTRLRRPSRSRAVRCERCSLRGRLPWDLPRGARCGAPRSRRFGAKMEMRPSRARVACLVLPHSSSSRRVDER